ncbi:MAG TPA: hypothetical protein VN203_02090, partial [Candidatus Acidoferrum sp.]|nr:hypothetical protein [Candidatus Acidoferrum sp.]
LVGAAASPGGEILVQDVGVNPTRSGLLEVLEAMGAVVLRSRARSDAGEPVADLTVRGSSLRATQIDAALVPRLLDEIPILAVAAALAEGETVISGAAELRVKEVDRLAALTEELSCLGVQITEEKTGLRIVGGQRLKGAVVRSHGDHRIAMALAIAGLLAEGETHIQDVECVKTSFPGFAALLSKVAPECGIREVEESS